MDPATAALPAVAMDPAIAALPPVPMDPATAALPAVLSDPATAALPAVLLEATTSTEFTEAIRLSHPIVPRRDNFRPKAQNTRQIG
jgi:hypothetical protein